jgi:MFS family permease
MSDLNAPAIYRDRDFTFLIASRLLSTVAMQVISVAIGWQIYDIERTPLALGLVGLCEFAPMFLLTLPAGEISDRFDQRRVLALSQAMLGVCAGLFLLFSLVSPRNAIPLYGVLILFGAARGFSAPSGQSILAFLVPPERLAKSIALLSSAFTVAVIAGPALGGFLFAFGPVATYSVGFLGFVTAAILTTTFAGRRFDRSTVAGVSRWERVVEGIRFVRERPIILGSISLDLFAVLFCGAVALLPVFARDILHVGPMGLGLLRSSPAVGAALTAFTLSRWPITRNAGSRMFMAVAVFGVATIVFGLSRNVYLSMAALLVTGAADMISVNVRQSLINFATPDPMRGRVGAVGMLFVGASNELGEFESGLTASWFGTIPAVILGGIGTLGVVVLWMWLFPRLRTVNRLTDVEPISDKPAQASPT